jgi:alkanesulfonate monooxygenase SsuD/methylene tetrahydromethanopterin reductase-like flavin-dependent oxidoreductase (luciferase family)
MRLALSLNYSGAAISIDTTKILEAERLGYDSVWTAEAYGSDAVVPAAWIAARTERIRVGTGIMQIPARTPAMTAMTAMTLDALSGGRFRLGLGVSGPQVAEGWHGQPFGKPLVKTREYVEVVRASCAGQAGGVPRRVLPDPYAGPGPPVSASRFARSCTAAPTCRIYLAAVGPRTSPSRPRSRTAGFRSSSPPAARSCSTSG